jgi:hypothetical protein
MFDRLFAYSINHQADYVYPASRHRLLLHSLDQTILKKWIIYELYMRVVVKDLGEVMDLDAFFGQ